MASPAWVIVSAVATSARGACECLDLRHVIILGRIGRQKLFRIVAVAFRPDIATDDDGCSIRLEFIANLEQELNGFAIDTREVLRAVTDFLAPDRIGAPGRRFKNEAEPGIACDPGMTAQIADNVISAFNAVEEWEGGEFRQVHALLEIEKSLQAAVGQKEIAVQLRQGRVLACHGGWLSGGY